MTFGLAAAKLTVFAAASLSGVFPQINSAPAYQFAGSDQLAYQIEQGAPADVYAAASPKYPQKLYAEGLVEKPRVFASNEVVLIVPRANPAHIGRALDVRRTGIKLVIGQQGVPIGDYTRELLRRLGILGDAMANVVSQETDVKGITAKVALGEADAGIVYRTDARALGRSVLTLSFPSYAQPHVLYELAVVKSSRNRSAARAFVARVLGSVGRTQLARAGFRLP
jgi:molybdate transport system substrate-binding protein